MIHIRISRNLCMALAALVLLAFCACDAGSDGSSPRDATSGDDVPSGDLLDDIPSTPDVPPEDPAGPGEVPTTGEDSGLDVAQDIPPVEDPGVDVSPDACVPECGTMECGPDPVCGVECGPCSQGYMCSDGNMCIGFPGMAFVAAGPFWMGCNEAVEDDCSFTEKPYHQITLKSYFIDRSEVTVADYHQCVQANACDTPTIENEWCHYGTAGVEDFPMNCVRWAEAADYCEWAGKRLPTEAEWEKAARGDDGRKHPWGNEAATCDHAVMSHEGQSGCGTDAPWEVCSRSPAGDSPYGLCDMVGNVWEWVSDWYGEDYYAVSPAVDPQGPEDGTYRVVRGGSYFGPASYMRTSRRLNEWPGARSDGLGFRCAKDVPSAE